MVSSAKMPPAAAAAYALRKETAACLLWVIPDHAPLASWADLAHFFAPERSITLFPAWDCLPYDRVSPKKEEMAQRLCALDQLHRAPETARLIIAPLSAISQRLPPQSLLKKAFSLHQGESMAFSVLKAKLLALGFTGVETVFSPGEFAIRGEIVDLFPAGEKKPYRLHFFEDTIETLHKLDPETQRRQEACPAIRLAPVREVVLSEETKAEFAQRYRETFQITGLQDPFFEAITSGTPYPGQEHWLPLFYPKLSSFFDYLPRGTRVLLFPHWEEENRIRAQQIADFYATRQQFREKNFSLLAPHPYLPLPPNLFYLSPQELTLALQALEKTSAQEECAHARLGGDFTLDRRDMGQLIAKATARLRQEQRNGKQLLLTCSTEGGRRRLQQAFSRDIPLTTVTTWEEAKEKNRQGSVPLVQLPLSEGFMFPDLWVLTEADLWGARLAHPPLRRRKGRALGVVDLMTGDYVVHEEHGIGQYKGLQTLTVENLRHDCLELWYDQGDKLYVPVENFEVVSRYGSEDTNVTLDRLGTLQWQNRKANVKERIGLLAQKLLEVAAQRLLKKASPLEEIPSEYDLFCARFPYPETEDQKRAIEDVEADFRSGHFADRLVCGDVGFGKTEVALRAAFSIVATGRQVAIVVPTTLLCRQHFYTFSERFAGFPPRIAFLSRLTPPKERAEIRKGLAEGTIDIVIGTQALLHNAIKFRNLGLLVIDEEQHFGVKQKEQLKALCTEVHVLTLTATPIPRTLQLSLTGVRDLSLIASPPIDRRAVHTFITPFDPVVLREAILRERARRGQVLYVCPRVSDLPVIAQFLTDLVPEAPFCLAHGQMTTTQLETTISDFLEGKYEILLATNIIESGIDIPTANTLILHRADLFGLSQLYQLRGRVGRAQVQAYAYFTYEAQRPLPERAKKRLEILERLDHLGAGFTLASFDLDLRGAGNLLGE
ncbi:MAG: transcription-repair coupling factor, partial [Holosporales bacterium]|nr:transcription-repair coupling factor [Holosporales bacterium]